MVDVLHVFQIVRHAKTQQAVLHALALIISIGPALQTVGNVLIYSQTALLVLIVQLDATPVRHLTS